MKKYNKIMAMSTALLFVAIGCVSITLGEPDDPIRTNRAPNAPVFVQEKGNWDKNCYTYCFYSEDPDGDNVYYKITWNEINDDERALCSPDDPVTTWLGPFKSGEEIDKSHFCYKSGDYELIVRVKDEYEKIGSSSVLIISYEESKILHMKFFEILKERHPTIFELLTKIFQ
jgi:hypothetical protein